MKPRKPLATALVLASFLASLALSSNSLAARSFYKWVDQAGVTHYTTTPPPGQKATLVKTYGDKNRPTSSPEPSQSKKAKVATSDKPGSESDTSKPQYQKNPEYCRQARKNLTTIDSSNRVRLKDASGQLRYLSHEEKNERRDEALKAIKINCN